MMRSNAATDKSPARIRRLFARITPIYDRMNTLMSAGAHHRWRARAARLCAGARRVLDVATGTGDMAAALRGASVVGLDCTRPMLRRARLKYGLPLVAGDALHLPFRDAAFDACTIAFGVRNFVDLDAGLRELARVLVPGGRLVVLELVLPPGRAAAAVLRRWVPLLGRAAAGPHAEAYRYLTESILDFAPADDLRRRLEAAGLVDAAVHPQAFGLACIVTATRPAR
jgi:demethylmenaquinone methyltransferase/2-methoxy-6-polyprenyl-1,4-benzoquinol methylase